MKEMAEMMDGQIHKNTAVMAELFELLCCPSSNAPESELSRRLEAHHGFVPKLNHLSGKNQKNNCSTLTKTITITKMKTITITKTKTVFMVQDFEFFLCRSKR